MEAKKVTRFSENSKPPWALITLTPDHSHLGEALTSEAWLAPLETGTSCPWPCPHAQPCPPDYLLEKPLEAKHLLRAHRAANALNCRELRADRGPQPGLFCCREVGAGIWGAAQTPAHGAC